jgi:hypothetical protein
MPAVRRLCRQCFSVTFDMCMYGLADPSGDKYRKGTRIISGFDLSCLQLKCDKQHEHTPICGSVKTATGWQQRSKLAGAYPSQLCFAWAEQVNSQHIHNRHHASIRQKKRVRV